MNRWKVWIDTGGTFTDCIALSPEGLRRRLKTLSNATLRGRILAQLSPTQFRISVSWPEMADIFAGYEFRLLKSGFTSRIKAIKTRENLLFTESPFSGTLLPHSEFEIMSGEEAPVLAARLLTQTPLGKALPEMEMRLGSTIGTNALLERKGAKTALLTTAGLGDLPLIGTQQRPALFALQIQKAIPLFHSVWEIDERISASGEILRPIDPIELKLLIDQLRSADIQSVAIAFLNSYRNPVHEQIAAKILRNAGFDFISLSAELAPAIKLLPRLETAVADAYLAPIFRKYLQGVASSMSAQSRLNVMSSAGGLSEHSLFYPKDSLLSGPAGGVVGAAGIASMVGIQKILTLDMGGTSTDVSRFDGLFDYRFESVVGDVHIFSPALAIETVAAGGGSVCTATGNRLAVGPESAGANPGPACYGAGGPLSLTDINLLLGRLYPEAFGIPMDPEASLKAFHIQHPPNKPDPLPDPHLLSGYLAIANEKMAAAIRNISIRKGYDPKEYALLAFGGAGGQHACQVAELLGIQQILIPEEAGLLSAFGMGCASIERFATRQVLRPLSEIEARLGEWVEESGKEAISLLMKEGFSIEEVQIREVLLFLRLSGQDASLEIRHASDMEISKAFEQKYRSYYGHWIEGREIELESIKVIAVSLQADNPPSTDFSEDHTGQKPRMHTAFVKGEWKEIPVYGQSSLPIEERVRGPAVILHPGSTTVVDPDWTIRRHPSGTSVLEYIASEKGLMGKSNVPEGNPDAAKLELFTNRFRGVAAEMGALLERTAFSVNVKERLDFSCALLDPEGYLVVNAPHIPVHLGSLGICVRAVKKALDPGHGDVIITNHPAFGGSHLPDITLIKPVYHEDRLLGYLANRAHHAELGGTWPGSMPPDARSLLEEGIVIPPDYLVKNGEAKWDDIREILSNSPYPSRAPQENLADLNAGLASLEAGRIALLDLCRKFGAGQILHYMEAIQLDSEAALRKRLRSFPKGIREAVEYLDDGKEIRVKLLTGPDKLRIDFSGSAAVHPGNLNATPAIVTSAVLYVLRLWVDKPVPLNEGLMRVVDLVIPDGMLNPSFSEDPSLCPAVVGGNTETSQRIVDTLLKALGLAACSQGTMNNVLFGNDRFGYYETVGGGVGAIAGSRGADAVHQHMTNTRITDPEILEFRYPVRLEKFAIRKGSGGLGKWNGGNGIERRIRFLEAVDLTLLSQHRVERPYGLEGGLAGEAGMQYIIRKNGNREKLSGIDGRRLEPGDQLVLLTPGGGGYGKPEPHS